MTAKKIEMIVGTNIRFGEGPERDSEDVPACLCRGFKIMDPLGREITKWTGREDGEYRT